MDNKQQLCESCPLHNTTDYRISDLESKAKALNDCMFDVKRDTNKIKTDLAVMQQKFDNIRIPIWIIFGAFLLEIAKWLLSFAPEGASIASKVM